MNINTRALAAAGLVLLVGGNPASAAVGGAPPEAPAATVAGLDRDEETTISLFAAASPSVVFITSAVLHLDQLSLNPMEMPAGTGSGFLWDRRGHVVTNFHVVAGGDALIVTLPDHSTWRATLVGTAPEKDLAVLKIDAPPEALRPLPLGESHDLRVGQKVFAIGNPFGLDHTLTAGIVSALGREIESPAGIPIRDVVQTDAAINPGNSGGPLLDRSGRLVGVNAAVYSPSGVFAGIGFAIPAHTVRWVIPELIAHGRIQRPSLGLDLLPEALAKALGFSGAVVLSVEPGGPAAQVGITGLGHSDDGRLVPGDLIEALNGQRIGGGIDLLLSLEERKPGDVVKLGLLREGERRTVDLTLAPWSEPGHASEAHRESPP